MIIDELDDTEQWAEQQWGHSKLGDKRRTARAVRLGAAMAAQPAASLPTQTDSWGDLKAAYRLVNEEDVTHQALSEPHWQATRQQAAALAQAVVLFVQDTSELDFTSHPKTSGLGHIGNTRGKGFLLHSCLAIRPGDDQAQMIIGVAAQHVWTRQHEARKGRESRTERNKRPTEAEVWAKIVEEIGQAPPRETGIKWVSVGDRASDIFSYLRRAQAAGWHCLLRVGQNRVIQTGAGGRARLMSWARGLVPQARKTMTLRGRDGRPQRNVELSIAWSAVTICPPQLGPERKQAPIQGWCIRCWEQSAPATVEAIEWILFTNVPAKDKQSVVEQVEWYSCRWMIEEYHKCLKTGCAMEQRQMATAGGLLALLSFLAIIAVRLLQLRELSRRTPKTLAHRAVPAVLIKVLVARLKLHVEANKLTVREFWQGVARLGGFIGRRSDGDPGWQTLWRGWQRLQDLSWSATLVEAPT
jgi:hypothetical protein